jgi:hypothetical protein
MLSLFRLTTKKPIDLAAFKQVLSIEARLKHTNFIRKAAENRCYFCFTFSVLFSFTYGHPHNSRAN